LSDYSFSTFNVYAKYLLLPTEQMYKEQMKDLAHTTSFDLDDFQAHLKV
jgi:hypothetical protein